MRKILSDLFGGTPGDQLPTYNGGWTSVTGLTGVMVISPGGGKTNATASGVNAAYYRADLAPPSPDYVVSADINFIGLVVNGPTVGVIARASSTANTHYEARVLSGGNGNGSWQLRRLMNGTAVTLSSVAMTYEANAVRGLALDVSGSTIKVLVDGVEIISVVDTLIADTGFAGIRSFGATSGRFMLSNFAVSVADAGGITTTVSPAAAALVVAGYAPSIAQTANQDVSPAPAALTVTGYAPTVTQSSANTISPAPAPLAVQGYAPTIEQTQRLTVSPAPAGLVVQGWAPTITQTGKQPDPEIIPAPGGGGGGNVREVRAFADELDRARKPTKAEKKRRRQAIETAVLELLPDVPAAEQAAPLIAQLVARELPPATWAPIHGPRPVVLPPAVIDDVQARVAEWLADQAHHALLAELEDDFEVELLLLG